jgi:hypothetical protein
MAKCPNNKAKVLALIAAMNSAGITKCSFRKIIKSFQLLGRSMDGSQLTKHIKALKAEGKLKATDPNSHILMVTEGVFNYFDNGNHKSKINKGKIKDAEKEVSAVSEGNTQSFKVNVACRVASGRISFNDAVTAYNAKGLGTPERISELERAVIWAKNQRAETERTFDKPAKKVAEI